MGFRAGCSKMCHSGMLIILAENKQAPEYSRRPFEHPAYCLQEFKIGSLCQEGVITINNNYFRYELRVVDRKKPSKAHLIKVGSVPHCLWMAQQTFVYQTLTLFYLPVNYLTSL